jgi:PhzF family phenazine biosynthesis protein
MAGQKSRVAEKVIPYYHVDVFSQEPFAGNGLIVFTEADDFTDREMLVLTQEMRQFESIFLQNAGGGPIKAGANAPTTIRARIFTCEEELDFAGHPILGAAGTLHDLLRKDSTSADWIFQLNIKTVNVSTTRTEKGYDAVMNQGKAEFGRVLNAEETAHILSFIDATPADLYPGLFPTVVSTGLPYLIVPLRDNKFRARVGAPGLAEALQAVGGHFIGILDIATRSMRTGQNDGAVEDIATGSLAGPVGAYLVRQGLEKPDTVIELSEGQNLGRNSKLYVEVRTDAAMEDPTARIANADVLVRGGVCKIASGALEPGILG